MFDRCCEKHNIEHWLTQPNYPWANSQVERINRTLKEATVKRFYYQTHDRLKAHLHAFLMAYTFAKRLKTLRGLIPYEYIYKVWSQQPQRFKTSLLHHTLERTI